MNSQQEFIKIFQKQNEQVQSSSSFSTLQTLVKEIAEQAKIQNSFAGMSDFTNIAKSIANQMKPFNEASAVISSSITEQIKTLHFPVNHNSFYGLTSILADIAKSNQKLSDSLSGFVASQLSLTSNLDAIAKSLSQTHLSKFNSFDVALKGISKTYLKDISKSRNWSDIAFAIEANEKITNASETIVSQNKEVRVQELDDLKHSIVNELYGLIGRAKTDKTREFIINLITIISFLLSLYSTYQQHSDISNQDVANQTRTEIAQMNRELSKKIESEFHKLTQTRISRTNVNLRYADKKNSKIIGLIKKGQRVTVIETRHKFILVSYIDIETGEPKSGFAIKKYFEKEK